jgi:hypothetical protein
MSDKNENTDAANPEHDNNSGELHLQQARRYRRRHRR